MIPLLVANAFADTPTVEVDFSPDAARVAVQLAWLEGGSGFPNARIFVFEMETGATLTDTRVRLTEAQAGRGVDGAIADARAAAAGSLADIDFLALPEPVPCADGRCGTLQVEVSGAPTAQKGDQCHGHAAAELLTVRVAGRAILEEQVPAERCPSGWTAERAWLSGDRALLLLGFRVPAFEGYDQGFAPVPTR